MNINFSKIQNLVVENLNVVTGTLAVHGSGVIYPVRVERRMEGWRPFLAVTVDDRRVHYSDASAAD